VYFGGHITECKNSWGILKNVKHCLDFSFVFSVPLPAARNLFSGSPIFCGERYQPGCTGIFWPAEGTSSMSLFLKNWKNQSSPLHRKWTLVQVLLWFLTCSRGLLASGRFQVMEGPVLRPFSYTKCPLEQAFNVLKWHMLFFLFSFQWVLIAYPPGVTGKTKGNLFLLWCYTLGEMMLGAGHSWNKCSSALPWGALIWAECPCQRPLHYT